jgi:ABC-2 type transport system permease protein
VPVDFARQLSAGHAQIQLVVSSVDTNTAATIESYVTGAIGIWAQRQADRAGN